ncbi:transcriptional regulator [Rhizobium leguminosarum]|uniref:helix-turn-helix domain-containing protein n=1 Tax=Rhizobium ruizarguesonis TaxID=2081791 RepID=UPI0013B72F10|nr:helix-turn-helix domain-containing protein [Rhizobium ruizarguesonis]NEJ18189.1 transcriptional regulator [Rhizobium ruizarguesonis]NEK32180.1 transcriptional regulator [Rhizobium ruizarguesonis]
MNMVSKIAKSPAAQSVGALLAEARLARGYSLDDVAETTGLTVAEVTALDVDAQEVVSVEAEATDGCF